MNNFLYFQIILVIIIFFIFISRKVKKIERYSNIHGNIFWKYWDTPFYIRLRKYPLWDNIYWGPSYWPGGKKIR